MPFRSEIRMLPKYDFTQGIFFTYKIWTIVITKNKDIQKQVNRFIFKPSKLSKLFVSVAFPADIFEKIIQKWIINLVLYSSFLVILGIKTIQQSIVIYLPVTLFVSLKKNIWLSRDRYGLKVRLGIKILLTFNVIFLAYECTEHTIHYIE